MAKMDILSALDNGKCAIKYFSAVHLSRSCAGVFTMSSSRVSFRRKVKSFFFTSVYVREH